MNFYICLLLVFLSKAIRKLSIFFKSDSLSNLATTVCLFATNKTQPGFDFSKYEHGNVADSIPNNIFVYWAQGFDNAPDVVKKCKLQVEKNFSDDFNIHFISDKNLKDYVSFPNYIYKYLNSGLMSRTHFSDILRFSLLKEFGGYWIDSTVFTTLKTKGIMKGTSFFTLRHSNYPKYRSFNEGLWTVYFIGTCKNSPLSSFISDYLISYWKFHAISFDYFHLDYAIALGRKKIKVIDSMFIENKDFYGNNRWLIANNYDQPLNKELDALISNDRYQVYKLSYKVTPPENKKTYFYKYYV